MMGGVRSGTRHSLHVDEAEWDDLASADATWAVCTNLDPGDPSQRPRFFESGRREIDGLMAGLAQAGVRAPEGPALDFGCGLVRKDAVAGYIRDFFRVAKPGAPIVFQVPSHVPLRVRAHPLRVLQRALRHLG